MCCMCVVCCGQHIVVLDIRDWCVLSISFTQRKSPNLEFFLPQCLPSPLRVLASLARCPRYLCLAPTRQRGTHFGLASRKALLANDHPCSRDCIGRGRLRQGALAPQLTRAVPHPAPGEIASVYPLYDDTITHSKTFRSTDTARGTRCCRGPARPRPSRPRSAVRRI